MLHTPNPLNCKGLSSGLSVLLLGILWLVPASAPGQERGEMRETRPRREVPIYDPGQPVQRKVLKNGVRLLVQEQRTSEKAAGVVALRMGTRYETEEESGLGQIIMRALTAGTERRAPEQLHLELMAAEAELAASAGPDMGQISISTKREGATKAAEILADVVLHPSFPDTAIQSARSYYLAKAADEVESPMSATYTIFLRTVYPESPFGRPVYGRLRAISEARRSDLLALYRKLFVGGNITVCFVGNLDGKKTMAQLEKLFQGAPAGSPPEPVGGTPSPLASDTLVSEERPIQAQSLVYGFAAPAYGDPDYPAFLILDSYLRSGDRSPISYWLPERQIATNVGVLYPRYPVRSSIVVYLGATPEKWKAARDTVASVFEQLTAQPLDDGEWTVHLRRAHNGYFKDQTNPLVRARDITRYETLGLGLDYPQRFEKRLLELTAEDVRATAARWFQHACEVTLRPQEQAGSRP